MNSFNLNLSESDKQVLALYIQAFATVMIGLLAWTAARGQNIIAEKVARKELFKLRYKNIYQEASQLFLNCYELIEKYNNAKQIKKKKEKDEAIALILDHYTEIQQNFNNKMQVNKFLIKPKDYDKLNSFCDEYFSHVKDYISGKMDKEICSNYYVATCFNRHYEVIPQILSSYLYHENESKLSFWIYKIKKYLKNHLGLFLRDYFPAFCEIISTILLAVCLFFGLLYAFIEYLKEILKAPISIKDGKIHFEFKEKSSYLKRNRPWPL